MTNRRITKKDPKKDLDNFLDYTKNKTNISNRTNHKASDSLTNLNNERKSALRRRLGAIIVISILAILGLGIYVSSYTRLQRIIVVGAPELNATEVIKKSGIKAQDQLIDYWLGKNTYESKLKKYYPEIKSAKLKMAGLNQIKLDLQEYKTLAYVNQNGKYYKILNNKKIARQKLTKMQIDKSIPIFVSYSNKSSLFTDLKALKSIPTKLRNQISIINGRSIRKNKIVLLMKDGNIIIGNTDTIAQKIKYYPKIKSTLNNKSVIDLEIGAFSYPLTDNEKNNLGF